MVKYKIGDLMSWQKDFNSINAGNERPLNYMVVDLIEQTSRYVDPSVIDGENERHFPLMAIYAGENDHPLKSRYVPIQFEIVRDAVSPQVAISERKLFVELLGQLVTDANYTFMVERSPKGYHATMIDPFDDAAHLDNPNVVAVDNWNQFFDRFNAYLPWPEPDIEVSLAPRPPY